MRADLVPALTDWLLTYWVHATVLLAAAALLGRLRVMSFAARDLLWKCALAGPLLTATAHSFIASMPTRHLDVAPAVAVAMAPAPAAASLEGGIDPPGTGASRDSDRRRPRLARGVPHGLGRHRRHPPARPRWRGAFASCSASGAGAGSPMPACATCSRRSAWHPATRTMCD